ncbi:hypothetical protein Tco_0242311 [Tanacetum coccineum]
MTTTAAQQVVVDNALICPRLPNKDFDELPSDDKIVTFIKELGHKGDIKSITEVVVISCYYAMVVASPKIKRKLKKPASPSNKGTLITKEEKEPEPAKNVKKAPAKVARIKGIKLLSDVTLLEEDQLKKALKRSKHETSIHKAGGSSEGADSKLKVPDETKGKSDNTSEGTGLKPGVPDVSKADSSESKYKSWGHSGDEDADSNDDGKAIMNNE